MSYNSTPNTLSAFQQIAFWECITSVFIFALLLVFCIYHVNVVVLEQKNYGLPLESPMQMSTSADNKEDFIDVRLRSDLEAAMLDLIQKEDLLLASMGRVSQRLTAKKLTVWRPLAHCKYYNLILEATACTWGLYLCIKVIKLQNVHAFTIFAEAGAIKGFIESVDAGLHSKLPRQCDYWCHWLLAHCKCDTRHTSTLNDMTGVFIILLGFPQYAVKPQTKRLVFAVNSANYSSYGRKWTSIICSKYSNIKIMNE